jgi:hypothetical protein
MYIEAELDPVHSQRLDELLARMNRPVAEILAEAIDALYRRESLDRIDEEAIVQRLRARFSHIPAEISLSDELIAERRQESLAETAQ